MASLFSVLGESLRADGLQPEDRRRRPRSQQILTCQKILRVTNGAPAFPAAADDMASGSMSRKCYRKGSLVELAKEASKFQQRNPESRYWRVAFIEEKYGEMSPGELKAKQRELRAAMRGEPVRRIPRPLENPMGGGRGEGGSGRRLAATALPGQECRLQRGAVSSLRKDGFVQNSTKKFGLGL